MTSPRHCETSRRFVDSSNAHLSGSRGVELHCAPHVGDLDGAEARDAEGGLAGHLHALRDVGVGQLHLHIQLRDVIDPEQGGRLLGGIR